MTWRDYFMLRKSSDPAPPPSPHEGEVRFYADSAGALRSLQPDGTDAPVGGGGGGSISVTDDSTTVDPATGIEFTSGATVTDGGGGVAQVAVGGSVPGPFAYFQSPQAAHASGDNMPWVPIDSPSYPDNVANAALIFDLTDPTQPAAVSDRVYAISLEFQLDAAHTGKIASPFLFFDATGSDDGPGYYGWPLEQAFNQALVNGTRRLTPGQQIQAAIYHDIGGTPNIALWALVQTW